MKIHLILLLTILVSCSMKKQEADLIIYNAVVYTCNTNFSVEQSIAVNNGLIIDVGNDNYILGKYNSKNIINAEKNPVYPGFYDAHCHFLNYGIIQNTMINLNGTNSLDELINRIIDFQKKNNNYWILGRGWDQNLWDTKDFPSKELLDKFFPNNPVYLIRIDGHAAYVNTKALELAGINSNTFVEGGDILKFNNEPTGILIDNAMTLVRKIIPKHDQSIKINALLTAQKHCFAVGLTSVADAGTEYENVLLFDSLHKTSDLKMRIYTMLNPSNENIDKFISNGHYITDYLSVRAVKLFADGALGSRGAYLLEDYSDDIGNKGIMLNNEDYINSICSIAYSNNYQVCTHCIGDAANRLVLQSYAKYLKEVNDYRWRIEHAQIINEDDFEFFGKYSIIPSIQACHATSDMRWAQTRIGDKRIQNAYAYKKLLNENKWLANGTDFPIEDICPISNFYAAVYRKDKEGFPENGFLFENALNREEALLAMTLWPAKAAFEDTKKGSLEVGKFADIVMLDKDIITINEIDILKAKVLKTIVGGEIVYSNN